MYIDFAGSWDAEQIAGMSRDLVETGVGWRWRTERVKRAIQDPETVVIKANLSSGIAGFAIMRFGWEEEAHLDLFAVKPQHRRNGIGSALLSWLENSVLTAGLSVVRLEVRETNHRAIRFYRQRGYRWVRNLPGYYQGKETAIAMARDLWCDVSTRDVR